MPKILAVLIFIAMVLHIIRPFGLPGMRHRRDFWKIGLVFIAVMAAAILLRS